MYRNRTVMGLLPYIEVSFHLVNEEYVPFYGMKLVAGRNLLPGDSTREVLISETFARAMGFADVSKAIGREVMAGPGSGWIFLAAGAIAIGIALLTVGFQAMKAARANPVKSLRTE